MTADPSMPSSAPSRTGERGKWIVVIVIVILALAAVVWLKVLVGGGSAVKETAEQFIRDLDRGDAPAALARCTSEIDKVEVQLATTHAKEWGGVKDISLPAAATHSDASGATIADVTGTVEFGIVHKGFSATLVKQTDGKFKIQYFKFE